MSAITPAGKLVEAFGDVDAMSALYANDVEWSISSALPFESPMIGRDAVVAFNNEIWGVHYFPEVSVTILDEVGDTALSAVRFSYKAVFRATGQKYENEYTLFVSSEEGQIKRVFEGLDTLALLEQLQGVPMGKTAMDALAALA